MSHGPTKSQTTTIQALMSLLKAYVGSGILTMPKAFSYSGYVLGVIGTAFIGVLCNLTIHMLVEINALHMGDPHQKPYDYEQLVELSFEYGPKKLRKYSKFARRLFTFCLCLTQIGFCCAYSLFIARNLLEFCINLNIGDWSEEDVLYFILFVWPFMVLLNFIRNIRHLAIGSMMANLIQTISLGIIIQSLLVDVPSIKDRRPFNVNIPQFVSMTVFTFEGITVSMPLYRSMKERRNFDKPFGVLNIAIGFVICLYTFIGFMGYLKYGDDVAASISISLPKEPLYDAVQLMYAAAISVSYPLQMYVAIHLIWPHIRDYFINRKKTETFITFSEYVFRTGMVTFTFILAAFIPHLDLIIELMGAFTCAAVALIIPPIIHLVAFTERRDGWPKVWLYTKDLIVIFFGFFVFIFGTYFACKDIIVATFNHDPTRISFLHQDIQNSTAQPPLQRLLFNVTSSNFGVKNLTIEN